MVQFVFESPTSHGVGGEAHLPESFVRRFKPVVVPFEAASRPGVTSLDGASLLLEASGARVTFTLNNPLPGALRVKAFHSSVVAPVPVPLSGPWEPPEADGFVFFGSVESARALPPLAISTADCLAVAFVVRVGDHVGTALVHAGWRGYTGGILQRAMAWLLEQGASHGVTPATLLPNFEAVVSPAIFGVSYECGAEVGDALEEHFAEHVVSGTAYELRKDVTTVFQDCIRSTPASTAPPGTRAEATERVHPDLQLLSVCDLHALGIPTERVRVVRVNTYGHAELPSYRAACHAGGDTRRRMFTHVHLV